MMIFSSSAATRRQVVAMGVSLWFRDGILRLSPDGADSQERMTQLASAGSAARFGGFGW